MGLNLLLVKRKKKKDWCISSSSTFSPISPTEKYFDICPWRIAAVVNSSNSTRKKEEKSPPKVGERERAPTKEELIQ